MSGQTVRSLIQLQNSASTARVLNLHKAWCGLEGAERTGEPMFRHPLLDRALVIKHRLRRDEADLFRDMRHAGTKIILPIDHNELRLGGQSLFVGQHNFARTLEQAFGSEFEGTPDYETLLLLDRLPSLDPFLLREHLRRHGRTPDKRYFEMSEADMTRMFAFVRSEVAQLVALSFGEALPTEAQVDRLVHKILRDAADPDMEPLRRTLKLAREEYEEGMFCWKGFLYYKWSLGEVASHVGAVIEQIATIRPQGQIDAETALALARSRTELKRGVQQACTVARGTLRVYDEAYAKLVREGRPTAFREFLLDAPSMFAALGERLGAVSHVVSFWRYRFPAGVRTRVSVEELQDVFMDFEASLDFQHAEFRPQAAAA